MLHMWDSSIIRLTLALPYLQAQRLWNSRSEKSGYGTSPRHASAAYPDNPFACIGVERDLLQCRETEATVPVTVTRSEEN
jgi:hypothetical protein